jgi:acyl-coenzyme A thioesterase PaaI-like protein
MDFQNQQASAHPGCFVCSKPNSRGLSVQYRVEPDGSVTAPFCGSPELEGYPGLLHGGIIAALLDGAMTNCLFAHGLTALTVELNVRYRAAVASCGECTISASLEESKHGLSRLSAQLVQNGQVKALATGKFMPKPDAAPQQP